MFQKRNSIVFFSFVLVLSFAFSAFGQAKPSDGTDSQRLDAMTTKLNTMKRSLNSAAAVMKEENKDDKAKKNDKENLESPLGRLLSLEKEASRLNSDVGNLRGKIDRGEKHERTEIDLLEQAVADLQGRVDKIQLETANARANPDSRVGTAREIKKKKKFLGIFGGGGNDEYDELIGSVTPGRDRELFVVATREVR